MKKTILFLLANFILTFTILAQTAAPAGGQYYPLNGYNPQSINSYWLESCFGYSSQPCKNIGIKDEANVNNGAIFANNGEVGPSGIPSFFYPEWANVASPSGVNFNPPSAFTICFSFKLTNGDALFANNAPGGTVLYSGGYNNQNIFSGYKISVGRPFSQVLFQVNYKEVFTNNFIPDTGVWYHAAFVYEVTEGIQTYTTYKIYINNQLKANEVVNGVNQIPYLNESSLFAETRPNPNYNSALPFHPTTNRPNLLYNLYRGGLDELRIYNRALTDNEIADVYNARLSSPYPAMSGFSPQSAVPGETITINGTNLSSTGTVTINGQSAAFNILSDHTITATMPATVRTTMTVNNSSAITINNVQVTNSSGSAQLVGNITPPAPAAVVKITGSSTACGLSVSDSALYVMTSSEDATYIWSSSTTNIVLSSGQGNDSIYVKFKSGFSTGTISCKRIVGNDTLIRSIAINKRIPSRPTSIIGNKNVCAYVGAGSGTTATYSVKSVQGASSYLWTLPDSVRVLGNSSAQVATTDTFINVVFRSTMSPDTIRVRSINACGSSTDALLALSVINPTFTSVISGSTDACPFMISDSLPAGAEVTYKVRKAANISSYGWMVPPHATIISHPGGEGTANDTIVKVIFNSQFAGGNIQVTGISNCYITPARSLYVYKRVPSTRSISTTLLSSCPSRQYRYSISPIAYATKYEWSVPSNATISGRTDSTFIIVNYSAAASGSADYIKVRGMNNCSIGNWSQTNVKLPACSTGRISGDFIKHNNDFREDITPYILENPVSDEFVLLLPLVNKKGVLEIIDASGKKIEKLVLQGSNNRFGGLYAPGFYFARLLFNDKVFTFRLVKQ